VLQLVTAGGVDHGSGATLTCTWPMKQSGERMFVELEDALIRSVLHALCTGARLAKEVPMMMMMMMTMQNFQISLRYSGKPHAKSVKAGWLHTDEAKVNQGGPC
jgi:hypothetical protein